MGDRSYKYAASPSLFSIKNPFSIIKAQPHVLKRKFSKFRKISKRGEIPQAPKRVILEKASKLRVNIPPGFGAKTPIKPSKFGSPPFWEQKGVSKIREFCKSFPN